MKPDRIGDDVQRELARFGPAESMSEIVRAWPGAVGEQIARNAWPARLARDRVGEPREQLERGLIRVRIGALRRSPQRMCPSITGYIFIPMYPPAKTASRLTEQARS